MAAWPAAGTVFPCEGCQGSARSLAQVLKANGAEMPSSLVETLWTIIQRLQVRLPCAAAALRRSSLCYAALR